MSLMLFTPLLFFPSSPILAAVIINKIEVKNRFDSVTPTPYADLLLQDKNFWYKVADNYLKTFLKPLPEQKVAKNVIIFLGDGMGISTITATRILKGQKLKKSGEEEKLIFESFPNVALIKTYAVDMTTPDSASTATALFTGVKTSFKAIGVDVTANDSEPNQAVFEKSKLDSIMTWAQHAQKDTGIITTTRITHATPAATYAKIHHRDWECESEVPKDFKPFVKDIATQLIEDSPGNKFKVILGGGLQQLGYVSTLSKDSCTTTNRNLTQEWINNHKSEKSAFVTNKQDLQKVDGTIEYLLGLFAPDHLPYELERSNSTPSLLDMTKKGLEVLSKSPNGFVLVVEGGRIDHGHHNNNARLALEEAVEFERTIAMVVEQYQDTDTLILVTADHSHTLTLNGYTKRGTDIFGYGESKLGLTLSYANGPGFWYHYTKNKTSVLGPWKDPRTDPNRLNDLYYQQIVTYGLSTETHGGEDVPIFAMGPRSHLVRGVFEQNYVAHFVSYAACIGPRAELNTHCGKIFGTLSSSSPIGSSFLVLFLVVIFCFSF